LRAWETKTNKQSTYESKYFFSKTYLINNFKRWVVNSVRRARPGNTKYGKCKNDKKIKRWRVDWTTTLGGLLASGGDALTRWWRETRAPQEYVVDARKRAPKAFSLLSAYCARVPRSSTKGARRRRRPAEVTEIAIVRFPRAQKPPNTYRTDPAVRLFSFSRITKKIRQLRKWRYFVQSTKTMFFVDFTKHKLF